VRSQVLSVVIVLFITLGSCAFTCWHGVNLSGLAFGTALPGVFNKDYTVPTPSEVDYFMGKGMNIFRLPFRWERLQAAQNSDFDTAYLGYIDSVVTYATGKGAYVLLDPHNYARYYNQVVGQQVPASAFADFWSKLSTYYKGNSRVIFGLMNEPNTMATELWLSDANTAIAAIRATGATNWIFVPGNAWTGAWSWYQSWYGTPNAQVMLGVKDPLNHFAFEVHQYFDSDHSGTSDQCVNNTIGSSSLLDLTNWLRQNKFVGFLGEWAGGRNEVCYEAIQDLTTYMDANTDVYLGWSWWAGGPWWGDYIYALDPSGGQDRPQMQYLVPHLQPGTCKS